MDEISDENITGKTGYEINMTDEERMKINYAYPDPSDLNLQYKIYKKREFNYHSIPSRPIMKTYDSIKKYRDGICTGEFSLNEHQTMLSNFINPNTPYTGILIFHGLGTGKTCVGVAIGEKFKNLVQKYQTKIYILVSGPLIKENWKYHLLKCTGNTYFKDPENINLDDIKYHNLALIQAMQYYKFMSYRSFYKHVLGEKIVDKDKTIIKGSKIRITYRKTEEGDFERDISIDRLYNLNNSLIIVDEAHNLTDNAYGKALSHIIKNSLNLKIVLLSGTPMKNLADDIVELINFIRPQNSQIERDKIFNSNKNHLMEFKTGGLEYLKKMLRGYISHVRGSDPLTFATRIDKGVKPPGLLFTKMIRCNMLDFQKNAYDQAILEQNDALDRKSEAVSNFVFPGLSEDHKSIVGYYGREGLLKVKNQLKTNSEILNRKISEILNGHPNEKNLLYISSDGKNLSGKIFQMPYLKYFSTKFYKALKKINRLVINKKGPKTCFVYSNLVKVGIDIFQQVLLQNGYLEYQDDAKYQIKPNTVCYLCGKTFEQHKDNKLNVDDSTEDIYSTEDINSNNESDNESDNESNNNSDNNSDIKLDNKKRKQKLYISSTSDDTDYVKEKFISTHIFFPATFVSITGKSNEDLIEELPEKKMAILKLVFNSLANNEGKFIKLILGSRVMNEGISLKNVSEVHILYVYYNLGKVDQVVGRAIRLCSHNDLISENYQYPNVDVYKYVVTLGNEQLSTEEELYKKAELKYLLIKKVELVMKQIAIDCPLNIHGNMFNEEIEKYKNCNSLLDNENTYNDKEPCPALCSYTKCDYICEDAKLNAEFYDPERKIYKKIQRNLLDYTTFTQDFAVKEIEFAKEQIKNMYILNYIYMLKDILKYVKQSYDEEKRDLFDDFFVYKALDELIPNTENDFNNFKDIIYDKHNKSGYLIYINNYYIFQPFDQNEDVPIYYRTMPKIQNKQNLSLYNYLKNNQQYQKIKESTNKNKMQIKEDQPFYNFDDTLEYYENRNEYDFVGYVDKELSRRKHKSIDEINDVFKLREKRAKILEKKRGTGIPSLQGAVCSTSKSKKYLQKVLKKLDGEIVNNDKRTDICKKIEDKMFFLEKYSTEKDKNKFTYVMIPTNHPKYKFPYNLEDRVDYLINNIKEKIKFKINIESKTYKKKNLPYYEIIIKHDNKLKDFEHVLENYGAIKEKNEWKILVD
jgi:superfamily II DNA or RNA helicase